MSVHSQDSLTRARILSDEQRAGGLQEQLPIQFGEFENSDFADFQSQVDKAFESDTNPNDYRYYEESYYDYDEGKYDEDDYDDTKTFEEWRIEFEKENAESRKSLLRTSAMCLIKIYKILMKSYQEHSIKVL